MKYLLAILIAATALSVACTDAGWAQYAALGKPHHIKQFSCGQLIGEWDSTGRVISADHSDGYAFEDSVTLKIVEISGEVQITVK